jgi:hypothetical protein
MLDRFRLRIQSVGGDSHHMNDCSPPESGNFKSVIFSVTKFGYRPIADIPGTMV